MVKTAGDGMLLEFGSADALRCAIDVQRAMSADSLLKPSDERIDFRIGINLGDIIVDLDRAMGCRRVTLCVRATLCNQHGVQSTPRVVRRTSHEVLDRRRRRPRATSSRTFPFRLLCGRSTGKARRRADL